MISPYCSAPQWLLVFESCFLKCAFNPALIRNWLCVVASSLRQKWEAKCGDENLTKVKLSVYLIRKSLRRFLSRTPSHPPVPLFLSLSLSPLSAYISDLSWLALSLLCHTHTRSQPVLQWIRRRAIARLLFPRLIVSSVGAGYDGVRGGDVGCYFRCSSSQFAHSLDLIGVFCAGSSV